MSPTDGGFTENRSYVPEGGNVAGVGGRKRGIPEPSRCHFFLGYAEVSSMLPRGKIEETGGPLRTRTESASPFNSITPVREGIKKSNSGSLRRRSQQRAEKDDEAHSRDT